MIQPESISENLQFSTVRIQTQHADGKQGCGTGFFFRCRRSDTDLTDMIVTNKHVVAGASGGQILVHLTEKDNLNAISNDNIRVNLDPMEALWTPHPDPQIDLCAMPVGHLIGPIRATGRELAARLIKSEDIPTQEQLEKLSAGEDVLMVGYPEGLWDEAHNLPIVRRGIAASHLAYDFNLKPRFMIDVACFPGSSGSPVSLVNQGAWGDKAGNTTIGKRNLFLGVLFAGPTRLVEGVVTIQPIPTVSTGVVGFREMLHLGFAVKSSEVQKLAVAVAEKVDRLTGGTSSPIPAKQ